MLLLSFLQKQQTSLKPSTDQLEISPCDINTLQNRVVMRIEHMITEDKSNRHFNKFSLQLLLEMYGDNKTEFWSFSHHQGKQAPIYHNSYLFLWAESCRPLPASPPPPPPFPLLDSLWHGKANVQNVCSRIFAGVNSQVISEFQKIVTFKTWPSAKPSLWKWVLFARE